MQINNITFDRRIEQSTTSASRRASFTFWWANGLLNYARTTVRDWRTWTFGSK